MSKISLNPGSVAINENGELGLILSKKENRYLGISLTEYQKVTKEGYENRPFTYSSGKEWSASHPQFLCHSDDLQLLGEKMYQGEETPFETPTTSDMEQIVAFCTVDILGIVTDNNRGLTDMGDNRWPGYHLTNGEVFNKHFEGKYITYTHSAGGPWSSSQPRPIIKVKDLIHLGAKIHAWAQNECVTV